jgi:hypothetical protein
MGMTIEEFYNFYKTQLLGKLYCSYKNVEDEYHYEREEKGYDHLGSLGYENVKVIDSYKTVVSREKINRYNVIDIARKLLDKKGWLEDGKID